MKTTKKIIAAILAVMMLALMIPMTASAEDTYSYTINTPSTTGYTFSMYKIADLNITTGEYSNAKSTGVLDALKTGNEVALLTAANDLDATALGTAVDSFTNNTASEQHSNTVSEAGVYYVKVTGTPAGVNVKSVTNSVFSLPYYNEGAWVDNVTVEAATKINDGTPTVTKKFTSATTFEDADHKTSTSEFIGNDVQFTLTGSVVGSTTEKAKAYEFVDTMSAGLTFKKINSVKLTGGTDPTEKALETTDYTYEKTGADNSFEIALSDELLSSEEFYSYSNVVVTYTATLNANAVIGGEGNPNKVDLVYTNSYDVESKIEAPEVRVYTAQIQVVKVDAANTTTKLSDAGFTLYTDAACNTEATNGSEQKTDSNGTVTFKGLKGSADGTTYYLKETTAPSGYNINSTVFEIEVFDNGTVSGTGVINNEIQVPDSKLVAPNTGGMGTAVFTICGASLVVLGGVLMLITLKKKKAAK